jgi:hypothetical protein
VVTGVPFFYMNFVVDLDCNLSEDLNTTDIATLRANRRVIIWNPPAAGSPVSNGYTRYFGTSGSSQWNIVGAPGLGLPTNVQPSGPLPTGGLTGFPNACIVDAVSADGGLPRNTTIDPPTYNTGAALAGTVASKCGASTAGALVLLGDSNNLLQREMNVRQVRIQNRLVTFN